MSKQHILDLIENLDRAIFVHCCDGGYVNREVEQDIHDALDKVKEMVEAEL